MMEETPKGLYGDARKYGEQLQLEQLKQINRSVKIIRQWVTVVGILATLILLAGLAAIVLPLYSSTPY